MPQHHADPSRRQFLAGTAATALAAASATASTATASTGTTSTGTTSTGTASTGSSQPLPLKVVSPPAGKTMLLSCKLGMIPKKLQGKEMTLADRLALAGEAGFDGVDLDQAQDFTPPEAREAVAASGVFVHNAINHAHWRQRLTSENAEERAQGKSNIEHCMRVSHAAGGCGVLIVIGHGNDGSAAEVAERSREEIRSLLPLAAALGQPILFENVWNHMFYEHTEPPEQTAEPFIEFVDSFNSPWVGMYYDIGNHWKYGQPGEWIRDFGRRCVKLDVKGFSRQEDQFKDIGEGDLPWDQVRQALSDIGFTGWATAEVGGGNLKRLTTVRQQMEKVFGL